MLATTQTSTSETPMRFSTQSIAPPRLRPDPCTRDAVARVDARSATSRAHRRRVALRAAGRSRPRPA